MKLRLTMMMALSLAAAGLVAMCSPASAEDEPKAAAPAAAPTGPPQNPPGLVKPVGELPMTEIVHKPPLEVDAAHPIGTMRNPYTDNADMIEAGKKLYFSYSCNGCHGGGGGGGMCPPLTNETWVYGSDDDILFRLISHGSQELQKTYNIKRKGQESVVGPMPPFGTIIKDDDELWKVIAFVHSLYKGSKRNW